MKRPSAYHGRCFLPAGKACSEQTGADRCASANKGTRCLHRWLRKAPTAL
ncbi:hypothetical protein ACCUM_4048 [Candidatus Accumulibacter phosphatis]|uniref:Uncharacterized protein n=1 Tax=Candidatus Accumulibacter phosphatis TaxID=327160 RepID=A0A5S4EN12_9PROT|nr:hypothetical protein ACCUM_4048 [Candidatus Accumulibacter phosphatis]